MRKSINKLVGRFYFSFGIGLNQITQEFKTIEFWVAPPVCRPHTPSLNHIKPKMFTVKPQPFSLLIKKK